MFAIRTHISRRLGRSTTACPRSSLASTLSPLQNFKSTPQNPARRLSSTPPRRARYVRFSADPDAPWDVRRWDRGTQLLAAAVAGGSLYYVVHLEQVPETGRWRFMDMSPARELKLGDQAYAELLGEFKDKLLPPTHPVTQHVRRIVASILEASDLGTLKGAGFTPQARAPVDDVWDPDATRTGGAHGSNLTEWNLLVVDDDKVVNAMATYGNVIVFTGILPICKDEQGLAAVLGHEIGHVVARHASERYSSMKVLLALATLLEVLGLDFGAARLLTTYLLELPNSRTQELEADKIGLRLSARACFDPRAAAEMHARLAQVEQKAGRLNVSFLYTHPTSAQRIQLLTEMLPEAYAIQAAGACGSTQGSFDAFRGAAGLGAPVGASLAPPPADAWE